MRDAKVPDEEGFPSRCMTSKANSRNMEERIVMNRVAIPIVFRHLRAGTDLPSRSGGTVFLFFW